MSKVELTVAQAIVRYLSAQQTRIGDETVPLFGGVFAIFGHGNVAGLGHALEENRSIPTLRAHNEQAMTHAAIAFAKANRRRRMMACTTSIGPGATNLVTAAATAHVNRLPVLLLPGDVFASRAPDPVLQQVEDFGAPKVTANDCLIPVSRYFDRIERPEQLVTALPQAMRILTDPAACGPVTLALPQDVQTERFAFSTELFRPRMHQVRRPVADEGSLAAAAEVLSKAEAPLIIAGGGVVYAEATEQVADFAERLGIPVAETQAGKGTLPWRHPCAVGGLGVTGTAVANALAKEADVVLALGTRLSDFTTASRTLFENPNLRLVSVNVNGFDAHKHGALPVIGDVGVTLPALEARLSGDRPADWFARAQQAKMEWNAILEEVVSPRTDVATDAQVVGAVNRAAGENSVVVCAAGGLPGELHKLWRPSGPGSYHVEYGYSCMGYEIAGGLGVKIAAPEREVYVMVGDGSYLMMNSEIATSVMMGKKLIIVLLDNRGFGCINRLQKGTGGAPFNNLLDERAPAIDFVKHAESMGAHAVKVANIAELEVALDKAKTHPVTSVVVIDTDPEASTAAGGAWWEVAVPEVSPRPAVATAREVVLEKKKSQRDA